MSTKLIRVSEQTYDKIAQLGTLKDSFDSVLSRLASSQLSQNGGTD